MGQWFDKDDLLELVGAGPISFSSSPESSPESTYAFDLYGADFPLLAAPFEALVAGLEGALLRGLAAGVTSPISKLLSDPFANLARLGEAFRGRESDFPPDETKVTECERFLAPALLDLPCFDFSVFTAGSSFAAGPFFGRVVLFGTGGV